MKPILLSAIILLTGCHSFMDSPGRWADEAVVYKIDDSCPQIVGRAIAQGLLEVSPREVIHGEGSATLAVYCSQRPPMDMFNSVMDSYNKVWTVGLASRDIVNGLIVGCNIWLKTSPEYSYSQAYQDTPLHEILHCFGVSHSSSDSLMNPQRVNRSRGMREGDWSELSRIYSR